jgi:drug/metabolite transporter (DMT)-like permease
VSEAGQRRDEVPFGARLWPSTDPRRVGLGLALVTALISGVSIYVNGLATREFADPTLFATLKNTLVGLALLMLVARSTTLGEIKRLDGRHALGLALLGVIGGSIPFVLFFEGLAQVTSGNAAFLHKTLFVWVAVLAPLVLRERLGAGQVGALSVLLLATVLLGGPGALDLGMGAAMVLAATLLWSVEVVLAKRLLHGVSSTLSAAARMGVGAVLLLAYVTAEGNLGSLTHLTSVQWAWGVGTAILLFGYVTTWYAALKRAPATAVTCVLTLGAPITALLTTLAGRPAPRPDQLAGYLLLTIAVLGYLAFTSRHRAPNSTVAANVGAR